MLERRPLLLGHPPDENCFCHGFAICTTSLESHFCHAKSKSLIPVIPGIFWVPALTGSVTEMAKQMAFGFAMPIFRIFRVIAFSCRLQSQILANGPFLQLLQAFGGDYFLSSHTLGPWVWPRHALLAVAWSLPPHGQVLLQWALAAMA